MVQAGETTPWSHENFLALSQHRTQHKLQQTYSNALYIYHLLMVDQRRAIEIMSAAGSGASSFLHAPKVIPECALSNQEFENAVKLRLVSKIYANFPNSCVCAFTSFLNKMTHELFCREPQADVEMENSYQQRLKQLWTNRISCCYRRQMRY